MTPLLARAAHLAALVGSAAIGCCAHEAATPAEAPAVVVAPPAKPNALPEAPLIAVASDGNVTLRVEQQPLEWVLEQIALQSGKSQAPSAPAAPSAAPQPAVPQLQPQQPQAVLLEAPQPEEALQPLVDP